MAGAGLGSASACPAPSPQAIATREELHAQHARSLQEKDALRKQVRELAEKADELQLQLFQREGQLLALEGRLKRQQLETLVLVGFLGAGGRRSTRRAEPPRDPGQWPSGAGVSPETPGPRGRAADGPHPRPS